jgi:ABC-type antimicrobial peptide transport system permease subunit
VGSEQLIPRQTPISWHVAVQISFAAIKRRFVRSMITMGGVVLGIAFMAYMFVSDAVVKALVAAGVDDLNVLLQKAGVDVFGGAKADEMMILLILLTVLTCTIGIMNSMLMSVAERVREIGTLKCLGARDQFILKMFLIESVAHGLAGAALGALFGSIVALIACLHSYGYYVLAFLPYWGVFRSLGICFAAGTLMAVTSSLVPGYLAARKQPVEALRVEE